MHLHLSRCLLIVVFLLMLLPGAAFSQTYFGYDTRPFDEYTVMAETALIELGMYETYKVLAVKPNAIPIFGLFKPWYIRLNVWAMRRDYRNAYYYITIGKYDRPGEKWELLELRRDF